MKSEETKKEDNVLTIRIKVEKKFEAYDIVNKLNFRNKVLSAEFNGTKEIFNDNNYVAQFLKDNSKTKKTFRDVYTERN